MGTTYHNKPIVTDGLVFYADAANKDSYPGSGTIATDLINSISGSLHNNVDFNSNNLGYWEFDGIDTGITFEEEGTLDTFSEITFALWINGVSGYYVAGKDNGSTGPFSILCRNSRWEWYVRTTDNWYGVLNNTNYGSGWKNVVGTWSGISNESKLYINGVQIGSTTSTVGSTLYVNNIEEKDSGSKITLGNTLKVDTIESKTTSGVVNITAGNIISNPNKPVFSGYRSTQYSTTNSIIPIDVRVNQGGHFNASNNVWTCPTSGFYIVGINGIDNASINIHLRKNSVKWKIAIYATQTSGWASYADHEVLQLTAGDTLDFYLVTGRVFSDPDDYFQAYIYLLT